MEHDLELFSPILEILEIGVCNIIYNPGNIGKHIFSNFSYPGNIGNRIFPISSYPGNIGNLNFLIFYYPGNIWILDFQYFLIMLRTFFIGGPGGRRAAGGTLSGGSQSETKH